MDGRLVDGVARLSRAPEAAARLIAEWLSRNL
jgi:hypothetical protein